MQETTNWKEIPKLKYIEPDGGFNLSLPLRVTQEEWDKGLWQTPIEDEVIKHARFTMRCSLVPIHEWTPPGESCYWFEMFEIALPHRERVWAFGPHKTAGLAKRKALNFLVEHHAIELISISREESGHV